MAHKGWTGNKHPKRIDRSGNSEHQWQEILHSLRNIKPDSNAISNRAQTAGTAKQLDYNNHLVVLDSQANSGSNLISGRKRFRKHIVAQLQKAYNI